MSALRFLVRVVIWLVVLGLGAAGVLGAYLGFMAWATLPQTSGTRVVIGASAPVRIVRDANGVPHIFGANAEDVYFGLGYAHAQDRFFQMDLTRRAIEGRLSELVGPLGLSVDAAARIRNWPSVIAAQLALLPERDRAAFEAYARGVNARLASGAPAPEYALLFSGVEPWRVEDSMACAFALAVDQTVGLGADLAAERLKAKLTPAQFAEFFPPYPAWGPTTIAAGGEAPALRGAFEAAPSPGSNAWALSGARTQTGAPLLASDPHLSLTAPAIFYLAHLAAPEGDMRGATLPGAPYVVLGQGPNGAWAFTNGQIDAEDFAPRAPDAPAGAVRRETIRIRGLLRDTLQTIEVRDTPDGPIADPRWLPAAGAFPGRAVALKSAADDPSNRIIEAVGLLQRAPDAASAAEAARLVRAPILNVVFAGRNGDIGYAMAGLLPARDAAGAWIGALDEAERPILINPPEGALVNANNPPRRAEAGAPLAGEFSAHRAWRISAALAAAPKHDFEAMQKLQNDTVSSFAVRLKPALAAATPQTAAGRAAQARLAAWDGDMRADSREALLFAAFTRAVARATYADELGADLYPRFAGPRPMFLDEVFAGALGRWCDDIATAALETCADAAGRALDAAAQDADVLAGGNWGAAHRARFAHPLFSSLPLLKELYTVEAPVGGDATSIAASHFAASGDYSTFHAAAYRAIYDLSAPERSRFIMAPGQSGHPFSRHYRDLAARWAAGTLIDIPIGFDPAAPPAGMAVLTLSPPR